MTRLTAASLLSVFTCLSTPVAFAGQVTVETTLREVREFRTVRGTQADLSDRRDPQPDVRVSQRGVGNRAEVVQTGTGSRGTIIQKGNDHAGTLVQEGDNQGYVIVQTGSGTTVDVTQTEDADRGVLFVYGW